MRFTHVVLFVAACNSPGERAAVDIAAASIHEPGFSAAAPAGWSVAHVRGLVQLAPASPSKQTIVLRSKVLGAELDAPQRRHEVIDDTRSALANLPDVRLEPPVSVSGTAMQAVRFDLSFTPRGLHTQYRRSDVLLVGRREIFHVIFTAPAGEPIDEDALHAVVASVREEG